MKCKVKYLRLYDCSVSLKHPLFRLLFITLLLFTSVSAHAQDNFKYSQVGPQPDGSILVPTNQLLRPAGFQVYMPGRPVDVALVSKEKLLLVKNMRSLDLIRINDRTILQSLQNEESGSSFTGLCVSKDNCTIYVTDATERILVASLDKSNILSWKTPITMPKPGI